MKPVALLALLLVPLAAPAAQVGTLRPVDEGAADPSFLTFRARLLGALVARDTAAVLEAFAPTAKLSFGDEAAGPDGVRALWFAPERPMGEDDFFETLTRVVALGSVMNDAGTVVSAPYVFEAWPASVDAFEHAAVIGENVRVREAPGYEGAVIATLTHALVPVLDWGHDATSWVGGWSRIRLADGREGYIATDYLYSPVGYRAAFAKSGGRWRIEFLVAGD